jgi:predicted DsbA family dithiol-disulfide isomerase
MRSPRPSFVPSHKALLGAEYAWIEAGSAAFDAYNEAVYRAFWERYEDISDLDVLVRLAAGAGLDEAAFAEAIRSERYADNLIPFDDPIYGIGVRHVPTFLFGAEEQMAEANYSDLAHGAERFLVWQERLKGRK